MKFENTNNSEFNNTNISLYDIKCAYRKLKSNVYAERNLKNS